MDSSLKFSGSEFENNDVASLPDVPSTANIDATQLKARFDNIGKMMIALGKHNDLVDALGDGTAAAGIGAVDSDGNDTTVQALLNSLENSDIVLCDTVAVMKANASIVAGQVVMTLGYNTTGDSGNGIYQIVSSVPSDYYERLDNGLYAKLIVENRVYRAEQFGAVGDGLNDDTVALQTAISNSRILKLTAGKTYKITNRLAMWYGGLEDNNKYKVIIGESSDEVTNPTIYCDDSSWPLDGVRAMLFVNAVGCRVENVCFTSKNGRPTGIQADHKKLVTDSTIDDNIDATIKNCRFVGLHTGITNRGRGPLVEGCTFTGLTRGIVLSLLGAAETNPLNWMTTPTLGGRGARIRNNRSQSFAAGDESFLVIFDEGKFFGSEICSNLMEGRQGVVYQDANAELRNVTIHDNVCICRNRGSLYPPIISLQDNTDCIIADNVLMGMMPYAEFSASGETIPEADLSGLTKPNVIIDAADESNGLVISGNQIENANDYGIRLQSGGQVSIVGNRFKSIPTACISLGGECEVYVSDNTVDAQYLSPDDRNFLVAAEGAIVGGSIEAPRGGTISVDNKSVLDAFLTSDDPPSDYVTPNCALNGHIGDSCGFYTTAAWASGSYSAGDLITDGTHTFRCTVGGAAGGTIPTFDVSELLAETADNEVTWAYIGLTPNLVI